MKRHKPAIGQSAFDFDYLQRKAYIDQATLPEAVTVDRGGSVSSGKMRQLLHAINDFQGKNIAAWPSQDTLAERMDTSDRTVRRAAKALASLHLLIVESIPFTGGRHNRYVVLWSDIALRDPVRADAFARLIAEDQTRSVSQRATKRSQRVVAVAGGTDPTPDRDDRDRTWCPPGPDMMSEGPDMASEGPDTMSGELLTNNKTTIQRTHPPRAPRTDRRPTAASVEPEWSVVVSVLNGLGLSASQKAVTAAIGRELTPDAVLELAARFERLRARNRSATAGWLYRWITGDSQPPPDDTGTRDGHRSGDSSSAAATLSPAEITVRANCIRGRLVKAGRRAGASEADMARVLAARLEAEGLPIDATTI